MSFFTGTLLASPIVKGASGDTIGTHYSVLGVGGYMEVETTALRNAIPVDSVKGLDFDGLSSGQRRYGMLVKVIDIDTLYELSIQYSTWTGLTETQKVDALANNGNWAIASLGGGGSGTRIEREFTQTNHGFIIGDVIAYSASTFVKGLAVEGRDEEVLGLVTDVTGLDTFVITFAGYTDNLGSAPLAGNSTYFLSSTVEGALTSVEPTIVGTISKPILTTLDPDNGVVLQHRGFLNATGATGGGGTGSTSLANVGDGTGLIFSTNSGDTALIRTVKQGTGTTVITSGDTVVVNSIGGALGPARDGTYTDGLFPFSDSTPTGFAVDDINEFLGLISPQQPPELNEHDTLGTFNSGKLSFGASKNDTGYVDVSTVAGNPAIDINEQYPILGTRKGITQATVTGILNSNTVGDPSGIPFLDDSFRDGGEGLLILELNGVTIDTLDLTSTTGATTSTFLSVSATIPVKFDNGNDLDSVVYRTGTYTIPTSSFVNGYNYLRVNHASGSFNRLTNYNEWVYDPSSTAISISGEVLSGLNLTGSRFVSGVQYNNGGTVDYDATYSNVYNNVYSDDGNAISFPNRVNLSTPIAINVSGAGIVNGTSTALPDLDIAVSNPQDTDIDVMATLSINSTIVIGTLGDTGKIQSASQILHPFSANVFSGGTLSETGFLIYNVNQVINNETEDFTGEVNRLEARDYTLLTYANIDGGVYAWDSTQDLITGNAQHNTGLLVINGEMMYPSNSYLTTQYGITNGDFSSLTNAPGGNPNYSIITGAKDYYRLFKSNNAITQSTLTFEIEHTGVAGDFLTDGATSGTPTGDEIKFEFAIKRSGGATHGWANPFAPSGNPEGIAVLSSNQVGNTMTVTCTLSTVPRVAVNDIVVARLFVSAAYSNRISGISITNI